jgi:uncharacterized delta-60 repeat protein
MAARVPRARGRILSLAALLPWAALAATVASAGVALAFPGDLDTSFSDDGTATFRLEDNSVAIARAVVIQPDGKIVTAGTETADFVLTRWNSDGTLDTGFGAAGVVSTVVGVTGQARALALQPDGKLVAVGYGGATFNDQTTWDFALARYEDDGDLDSTFGVGGITIDDLTGTRDLATGVVLQPDGTLVVVGFDHFILARYLADGTRDTSFGSGGYVTITPGFPGGAMLGRAILRQPDGKLVVAGQLFDTGGLVGFDNFAVARFHPDGALDSSFGGDGRVFSDFPSGSDDPLFFSADNGRAIVLQADGKLVVAGQAIGAPPPGFLGNASRFALARYEEDGDPDPTFGSAGIVLTEYPGASEGARALALQPDGKLVVAGEADATGDGQVFALARYKSDGKLDATFGACGLTTNALSDRGIDRIHAIALQSDGSIVGAGEADPFVVVGSLLGIARYEGGDLLACAPAPAAGCTLPAVSAKALLQVKDDAGGKGDRLSWKWLKGGTTAVGEFGEPLATTDYAFCVYDESGGPPALLFEAAVPAGGVCDDDVCWKPPTGKGFKYKDRTHRRCGVDVMKLQAGEAGKAKVIVKAKGERLPVPALPLPLPLRVQLQAANGECWEAIHSANGVLKNDSARFKGRAD